jgi:hypothetical protein
VFTASTIAVDALSPFQCTWLAIALPTLLTLGVWLGAATRFQSGARWVLGIGGLLAAGVFLAEAHDVLGGRLPWEEPWWRPHLEWTLLGGVLWATDDRTRSPRCGAASAALAVLHALLGAWVPAVVMVGLDRAARLGTGARVALAGQALFALFLNHWPLELAERLGFLGLSIDGTTIAAAWVGGAVQAALWGGVLLGVRPPRTGRFNVRLWPSPS